MKFKFKNSEDQYKNDLKKLLIYDLKDDHYLKVFLKIYLIIVIVFLLNFFEIISFYSKVFNFLSVVLGVGILGMIIHSLIEFYIKFNLIKKKSTQLKNIVETVEFSSTIISVDRNGVLIEYSWNSFEYFLKLKNTIFLIPVNQNDDFLRFNKSELIYGDFNSITTYIQNKWGTPVARL